MWLEIDKEQEEIGTQKKQGQQRKLGHVHYYPQEPLAVSCPPLLLGGGGWLVNQLTLNANPYPTRSQMSDIILSLVPLLSFT